MLKETEDLDAICKHLIDAANDAGGRDNVTCVLVRTCDFGNLRVT